MNLSRFVIRTSLCAFLSAAPGSAQYLRGVNLAGAEFGDTKIPGVLNRDYTWCSENTFRYFAVRNLPLTRFAVLWERMQPALRGPLDPDYLAGLKRMTAAARAAGSRIVIDVHNYGRYKIWEDGKLNTYVLGGAKISAADLADLWIKLSAEFRDDLGVYAYGLMNEPHDMPSGWKAIAQEVLTAIRAAGDNSLILVPGDSWSSANRWPAVHGPSSWISDPAGNFAYEAHLYFDRDESGSYAKSYDDELKNDPDLATAGARRLKPFLDWCRANNVKGFLGEFGVPGSDPRWLAVLDGFLSALDAAGFDGTYWAAGEWWGNYALGVQPQSSYTVDRPQMAVLLAHLPPGAFLSVSAASNGGFTFAPDSLLSGYGASLGGAAVELTDSTGLARRAGVLFASPTQINYLLPSDLASGRVTVKAGASAGVIYVDKVAPTLFPIAQLMRIDADGARSYQTIGAADEISLGGGRVFLTLYGTGFRNASGVTLWIGAASVPVGYAGPQGEFPGLDQINCELPATLAGAGKLTVAFKADGKIANPLTLQFR